MTCTGFLSHRHSRGFCLSGLLVSQEKASISELPFLGFETTK